MPEASEGRRGLVMGRWKKPTHSQVVGAVAAIPGLLFLTTRKFLPVSDDCEHDGDCINVHEGKERDREYNCGWTAMGDVIE